MKRRIKKRDALFSVAVSIVVEPGKQGHVCWIFYSLWEIKISVNKYATVISDSRPPGTQEGEKYL